MYQQASQPCSYSSTMQGGTGIVSASNNRTPLLSSPIPANRLLFLGMFKQTYEALRREITDMEALGVTRKRARSRVLLAVGIFFSCFFCKNTRARPSVLEPTLSRLSPVGFHLHLPRIIHVFSLVARFLTIAFPSPARRMAQFTRRRLFERGRLSR